MPIPDPGGGDHENNEVSLISDGDGIAVLGHPTAVDHFLESAGVESRELGLARLQSALGAGSGVVAAGAAIAENSGRWVQLTKESAKLVSKNRLMTNSASGLSMGVVQDRAGQIKGIVQFAKTGTTSILGNPAVLSGVAGIMAQLAMQQAMDEMNDYLAKIDEKVDNVLRAQKDAVLADMIGIDLLLEEAMIIHDRVGSVSQVTWSKIQSSSATLARTQGYALRQLDAQLALLEKKVKVGELVDVLAEVTPAIQEWLAVLARCVQLQDATAFLELDKVLGETPDELDRHRLGLKVARQNRLNLISRSSARMLERAHVAGRWANGKVLMHPRDSQIVLRDLTVIAESIHEFHHALGIERDSEVLESRRWLEAVTDAGDKLLETGTEGLVAARTGVTNTAISVSRSFRSIDRDGDGVLDEPKVVSSLKDVGGKIASAVDTAGGLAGRLSFKKRDNGGRNSQDNEFPID